VLPVRYELNLYMLCRKKWRLAAKILHKQSRTDNKGWPSSLGVGCGVNNPSP
jgi:hypothetical protein